MKLNRRQVVKGMAALPLAMLLPGCAKKADENVLEVAVFNGGYGIDFYQNKAKEFAENYPEKLTPKGASKPLTIKVWGTPRVWTELQPRFVKGDVPDICWPGWGMDYWKLIAEGQIAPVDEYLSEQAFDQKKPWKDTFVQSLLRKGQFNGKQYIVAVNNNVLGWWYDADLFSKNGWMPPRTYPELLSVCKEIKAKGIEPITYQGKYLYYVLAGFVYPWVISLAGVDAFNDAQDLKPGAWKSPAFLQAAVMVAELRDREYFAAGALGKTHLQAQTDFASGKAAIIPCGTWLANENKQDFEAHPNFKLTFLMPSTVPGGKGDPTAIGTGTEDWVLPAKSKHPQIAMEFFKFLTSLENSKQFVRAKQTFTTIIGSEKTELPENLQDAAVAFGRSKTIWSAQYQQWYPGLKKNTEDAMKKLLSGDYTPQQCVDAMEQAAQKIRDEKTIIKHTVNRG